ncbi:hypothetical protein VIGAN_01290100 [Vigna angularis var. angularis]|uniref:Cytochrome c assembly protein domain-containing protein n=1 Tax=Vigna angularis var. angularis TaxID=157739 RepID=A0A0S3R322_PHAAN|nr:hypothetical protein VIGAN_01290100 [Vigna angularis var. angularis]
MKCIYIYIYVCICMYVCIIGIFLTIDNISRAVWANEAWGSYWNWDPKETWAFITWTIFAIYLHTRKIKKLEYRSV